ncbi:hypothetical protein MGAS27061_0990 [Streptococcus pyogenes]|nr:hypothetical protein MGAS27061_0990 [Streptococcus pyogenes]
MLFFLGQKVQEYLKRRIIMGLIWTLIVGALIGVIAGALTKKGGSMGWIANIAAGLVGSSVGQALLGSWGPSLAGMSLIPSVIGAVIVVMITSFVLNKTNN